MGPETTRSHRCTTSVDRYGPLLCAVTRGTDGMCRYRPPMVTPDSLVEGTVLTWHEEDGWGVLRAPDGTEVWCHYSQVDVEGYRSLSPGEAVTFDYETPGQDGYPARVFSVARRSG